MTTPTRDDLALYVTGNYDGDVAALEAAISGDARLQALLAEEAALEGLLREAAAEATFCPACDELVRAARCDACGAALRPGGYAIERVLRSGPHGRMYVARDADGKRVALKELAFVQSPSVAAVAAFEREAKFLRALEHPAIPRFCASFEEGEGVHTRYYLAQELVDGEPLDAQLDNHWYREAEIIAIAREVLGVIVYLQSLSPMVIHRDIKPANLIRRADGTIAVVDFGAAYVQGATAGSTSIGTFGYMPIEQLAGEVDATTDPYALGSSLVHLLTRQEPWRLLQGSSLDSANLSAPVRAYLTKLIAPDPRQRYASAAAALAALEAAARGERAAAVPAPRSHRRFVALVAAALVVSLGGVGGYATWTSRPTRDSVAAVPRSSSAATAQPVAEGYLDIDTMPSSDVIVDGHDLIGTTPTKLALPAGDHTLTFVARGVHTDYQAMVYAGATHAIRKALPGATDEPARSHLVSEKRMTVSMSISGTKLSVVLRTIGLACSVSIVLPDDLQASVTAHLDQAPCDQVLETILEAHDLWYTYDPDSNIVRVGTRKQLQAERWAAATRFEAGRTDDTLPSGPAMDLDREGAPLREVMQTLAAANKMNIVVPESITGRVTIRLSGTPWDRAVKAILASQGLWYRYDGSARMLRIAPRKQIDDEFEATRRGL